MTETLLHSVMHGDTSCIYLGGWVPSRGRAARVLEQQHLVVAEAVDVEGAEQVTQLHGQRGQSLGSQRGCCGKCSGL